MRICEILILTTLFKTHEVKAKPSVSVQKELPGLIMSFDATAINCGARCLCYLNDDVVLEGSVSSRKRSLILCCWHVM